MKSIDEIKDLDKLDDLELDRLAAAIDGEKKARAKAKVKDLQQQARKLAADLGVTVDEVLGSAGKTPKRAKPKYRGPEGQEWSGRGNKPKWFAEALENGVDVEAQYRIKDDD